MDDESSPTVRIESSVLNNRNNRKDKAANIKEEVEEQTVDVTVKQMEEGRCSFCRLHRRRQDTYYCVMMGRNSFQPV